MKLLPGGLFSALANINARKIIYRIQFLNCPKSTCLMFQDNNLLIV